MSFQQWEIPFGQEGVGPDLETAILDAIGTAIARELVEVSDVPIDAQVYSLKQSEVDEDVGLVVLENNLAVCMGMPYRVPEAWQDDVVPETDWPRVLLLPQERPWVTMHTAAFAQDLSSVTACVYRVVRHVESTSVWTDWLADQRAV